MRCLNLGCGKQFHPAWTNIDFISTTPEVMAWDLTKGLPFENETFDVVYHSHFLEHLSKPQASELLQDCYRVLRRGGILRVVVPDLEQIVRSYLATLETALSASPDEHNSAHANYEWMVLELYDQALRHHPGGEAVRYLRQDDLPNAECVRQRGGKSAQTLLERKQNPHPKEQVNSSKLQRAYSFIRTPKRWREYLIRGLLGEEYSSLQLGRFRKRGEVHQWMYDRYSLQTLLQNCGFLEFSRCTAMTSQIPNWASFCLDTEQDGSIVHPDSLYIEAIKR
jgi:predicted SAM-dependent methyltransferase